MRRPSPAHPHPVSLLVQRHVTHVEGDFLAAPVAEKQVSRVKGDVGGRATSVVGSTAASPAAWSELSVPSKAFGSPACPKLLGELGAAATWRAHWVRSVGQDGIARSARQVVEPDPPGGLAGPGTAASVSHTARSGTGLRAGNVGRPGVAGQARNGRTALRRGLAGRNGVARGDRDRPLDQDRPSRGCRPGRDRPGERNRRPGRDPSALVRIAELAGRGVADGGVDTARVAVVVPIEIPGRVQRLERAVAVVAHHGGGQRGRQGRRTIALIMPADPFGPITLVMVTLGLMMMVVGPMMIGFWTAAKVPAPRKPTLRVPTLERADIKNPRAGRSPR